MRDEDAAAGRRLRAGEDRLADASSPGPGSRRSCPASRLARNCVALVDEEQGASRATAAPTRRSRSRPRRRARRASASRRSGPGARRPARTTATVTTTSAASAARRGPTRRPAPSRCPSVAAASVARAAARSGWRSKTSSSQPGRTAPRTGRWLRAWTPAPRSGDARRPARRRRAEPADRDAADRRGPLGGDRAGVEDRRRDARSSGSVRRTRPWIAGEPELAVGREARDPLDPEQVVRAVRLAPRRWAGIAWANEPSGRGWTPIFGGSSASATSATIVRSASRSRSSSGGIAAATSAAFSQRSGGASPSRHRAESSRRVAFGHDPRSGPEPGEPAPRARRDPPLRRPRAIEKDPQPGRRLPADRRQRAAPRRGLGGKLREAGDRRPARPDPAPAARRGHHPRSPGCSGRARSATSSPPSRATRRRSTASRRRPEVEAIAADEREHAEIWRRLKDPDYHPDRRHRQPRALASVRPVGDAPGGDLRGQRRPGLEPRPRDGRRRARRGDARLTSSSWPASPASSPARSAWPPASTSRCRASASCSSARSPSSGPRWRRCPRRRRPRWPPSTGRRGSSEDEAKAIAHRLFEDPERALDQLIREELGLDPDELGSPLGAAGGSFVAFAIGAFVPVLPYLLADRRRPRSSSRSS